ncbi:succinate dehydrogenase, hydrophobic membrane anchor protein [Marinihelvus fidelis]|uniref:Succinate dehydrogenase hydrophobic membrane anchor subunit n=1 Tax=Marinihelvus fidelis TaxID=2613842 RepID=A0A5N0TDN8_9GAMM|nr:succinate dehydrogenase, hydrophobic membrane anchor protein [Marinihelvus fidelis]KAA9131956.1 succinate dehydrogenase, hydrophobic membrane anchor protein [Marinihelvus fidelis]
MSGATTHWFRMRISSIVLVPLCLWLLWAGVTVAGQDYAGATAFMGAWYNAMLAVLFAIATAWHIQSGIGEVIEDYVPAPGLSRFLVGMTRGACLAGVVVVAWSVYTISTGAA